MMLDFSGNRRARGVHRQEMPSASTSAIDAPQIDCYHPD
jgi:hypothetical protein